MTKLSDITKLVDHLNKAIKSGELTEASLKIEDLELVLKKEPAATTVVSGPAMAAAPMAAPAPVASAAPTAPSAAAPVEAASAGTPAAPAGDVIKSPMVGTAYLSPEPGKPAFVSVGDQVNAGDTLMIIEAMKVMNTLEAPRAGTITEIHVADGTPIEFDEPLFVLS